MDGKTKAHRDYFQSISGLKVFQNMIPKTLMLKKLNSFVIWVYFIQTELKKTSTAKIHGFVKSRNLTVYA